MGTIGNKNTSGLGAITEGTSYAHRLLRGSSGSALYTPTVNEEVYEIGAYLRSDSAGPVEVAVYDVTGLGANVNGASLIGAEYTATPPGSGNSLTWYTKTLTTPWQLTAGRTYAVAVRIPQANTRINRAAVTNAARLSTLTGASAFGSSWSDNGAAGDNYGLYAETRTSTLEPEDPEEPEPEDAEITGVTGDGADTVRAGEPFTITGSGFEASQGAGDTKLGGISLTESAWSDTSIAATAPASGLMFGPGKTLEVIPDTNTADSVSNITYLPPTGQLHVTYDGSLVTDRSVFWDAGLGAPIAGLATGDQCRYAVKATRVGGTEQCDVLVDEGTGVITLANVLDPGDYAFPVWIRDASDGSDSAQKTITVDATPPTGHTVSIDQGLIDDTTHTALSFTFAGAEVGAAYSYEITSDMGGVPVTGSGTIATATDQITGIDVSGLPDGTLTLSVVLADPLGNTAPPVTDTVLKDAVDDTAPVLQSATINATGDELTLVFDEPVDVGADGWSGFFLALSGPVVNLTYDSGATTDTIAFALDRVVLQPETGTLAYSQPGDGVHDTAPLENLLGSFSGFSITNTSTVVDTTPPVLNLPGDVTLYIPYGDPGLSQDDPTLVAIIQGISATDETYPLNPIVTTDVATLGDPIPVGVHVITASATDQAGNTATDFFTLTVAELAIDETPDPFAFAPQMGVPISEEIVSDAITITGVDPVAILPVSITGGEYSINGDPWTALAGAAYLGDVIRVRHTSGATFSTDVSTALTVGGVSATFVSRTVTYLSTKPRAPFWRRVTIEAENMVSIVQPSGRRVVVTNDSTPVVFEHDLDARLDYWLDWRRWLRNDEIVSINFSASGVAFDSAEFQGGWVVVWLSSPTNGVESPVTCSITTKAGRQDDKTFYIKGIQK